MKLKLRRVWSASVFAVTSIACHAVEGWVHFSADGSRVVAKVDGVSAFDGVSSASFESGSRTESVGTASGTMLGPVQESEAATPFGDAVVSTATYGAPGSPYQYTVRLTRLKTLRVFTLQATLHNGSDHDVRLHRIDLLNLGSSAGGMLSVPNPARWLVTPLMEASPALPLSKMERDLKEAALVCGPDGAAFLVGPVGTPEAYTSVDVRQQALDAHVRMDDVLVPAGGSRSGQEMVFSFEPRDTSIEIWTRWVAISHRARTDKDRVYGWCSWYDRTTNIDEAHVLNVTKTIAEHPEVFGKGIIQVDDGYQKMDGDWTENQKFPTGLTDVARQIRQAGCIPGIWFAPLMINPRHPWSRNNPDALQRNGSGKIALSAGNKFRPEGDNWIIPDNPKSKQYLASVIKQACERGYGYLKIDFNNIGSRFYDPTKTRLQEFRELYALYRHAAGDGTYILSCLAQPDRGVIGYADAVRVGPDSHPANLDKSLESVLRFQIYNKVWWHNDPDVSYLAPALKSRVVGRTTQGKGMWQTWHNVVCLVGGTAMISEPVDKPDARDVWRNFEVMRPSSSEPARLLTLGKSPDNAIFGFAAARPYGNFAVYNFYNSTPGTKSLNLAFGAAGLPAGVKCAVFDFWRNQVIGYAVDAYTTDPLEYHSSALLRFTPLDREHPVLVGSDFHLSVGATEIHDIRVSPSAVVVCFSDAGARTGTLTFYSEVPLAADAGENCTVSSVENVGANIWSVKVGDRRRGMPQSITLRLANAATTGESDASISRKSVRATHGGE